MAYCPDCISYETECHPDAEELALPCEYFISRTAGGGFDPLDEETWESPGQGASYWDPHNAYSSDGQKVGRLCACEDYPCCGH